MKNYLSKIVRWVSRVIGIKRFEKLLIFSAKAIDSNLHLHGLIQIGASCSFDSSLNGEELFIKHILPGLLGSQPDLVIFDIGANIGDYTTMLNQYFPLANIYSFEPVESTYELLKKNTHLKRTKFYKLGFGEKAGTGVLYNTISDTNTQLASIYKDVFNEIFKSSMEISTIKFPMDTLDDFCVANHIDDIDFLKVDVEGHELSVLKGGVNLLKENKIKIIQFEFNLHNVFSRVFLKDFYLILDNFEFFRLYQGGMMILGAHDAKNEIFSGQNIIAVHKTLSSRLNSKFLATL